MLLLKLLEQNQNRWGLLENIYSRIERGTDVLKSRGLDTLAVGQWL